MFSSLDASSGFWHNESSLLTTFITSFSRYCFKCLPFDISIAQEIFQRKMNKLVSDLDGLEMHGQRNSSWFQLARV